MRQMENIIQRRLLILKIILPVRKLQGKMKAALHTGLVTSLTGVKKKLICIRVMNRKENEIQSKLLCAKGQMEVIPIIQCLNFEH